MNMILAIPERVVITERMSAVHIHDGWDLFLLNRDNLFFTLFIYLFIYLFIFKMHSLNSILLITRQHYGMSGTYFVSFFLFTCYV